MFKLGHNTIPAWAVNLDINTKLSGHSTNKLSDL